MKTNLLLTLIAGSVLATAQPSVVSVTPLNGTGSSATFTSVYRHTDPAKKYLAYLLILPTPNVVQYVATGSCLLEYNPVSNGMRLIDNAGTGWISFPPGRLEGAPVGPGGTVLSNNFCNVHTATVSVSYAGNDMTVRIPVNFQGNFTGPLGTFLQHFDRDGAFTGMTQFGNWTAYPITTPKPGPYVRDITVTRDQADPRIPTYVVLNSGSTTGLNRVAMVNLLVSDKIVGGAAECHIVYFPPHPGLPQGEVRLLDRIGNSLPQENGRCAIGSFHGQFLTATGSTNEVRLGVPMVFNPALLTPGTRLNVWVNTFDTSGNLTHWIGTTQ